MLKPSHPTSTTEVLLGKPVTWPKVTEVNIMTHVASSGAVVVFEDDHVIAFEENDDEREGIVQPGERRITIAPKKHVPSIMDIDLSDHNVAIHLLYAIQQVAYKLQLYKTGFEVRADVLPPYQTRPHIRLKIRTGTPKKSHASAPGAAPKPTAAP